MFDMYVAFKPSLGLCGVWKNTTCQPVWWTAVELEVNLRELFSWDGFSQMTKLILKLETS